MLIFKKEGRLTAADSKTNTALCFCVPDGAKRLKVTYSYAPKTVENKAAALAQLADCFEKYNVPCDDLEGELPVKNLVTLSFDDPQGYRGACHRQPNEQVIIIGESSTPGIENRKIEAGEWRAVLNAHYIGCDITYSLVVEEVEE